MSSAIQRRMPLALVATLATILAIALVAAAESHTWDTESDFAGGDFDSTVWDAGGDGVAIDGRDAFWKYRGNAVILEGPNGDFDDQGVLEPCAVFAFGKVHLYYVGYDGSDYSIGLARSPDGESFQKSSSNPVLSKGSVGTYDASAVRDPFVVFEDGILKMWYTAVNGATESIAYATSKDGESWTKYGSNPVLSQPSSGWGSVEFGDPSVVKVDGRYYMYLSGSSVLNGNLVGLATSKDGTSWTYHSNNPVMAVAGTGEFGRQEIHDVAVVRDGPLFRMYFTGRNTASEKYRLGYAWSYDGYKWDRLKTPYIKAGGGGSFDSDQLQSPGAMWYDGALLLYYHGDNGGGAHGLGLASYRPWIQKDTLNNPVLGTGGTYDHVHLFDPCVIESYTPGVYYMYYSCYGGTDLLPYAISLASSGDPTSWSAGKKYGSNPILSPGTTGAWDDEMVTSPCVIMERGMYKMWYSGFDGSEWRIGYATSTDGIAWTKYGSNPVLSKGSAGDWDDDAVADPWVARIGGTYHMWYRGNRTIGGHYIGHATSTDGTSWTKDSGNPVLVSDPASSWEQYYIDQPVVVQDLGRLTMYYAGSNSDGSGQRIGVAYSTDGVDWTREALSPVMDMGNSSDWDDYSVHVGSVLVVGGSRYVYYSGNTSTNMQVGLAWLTSGMGWYTTPALDASSLWPVKWGTLSWDADVPAGTRVRFQVATNLGGSVWRFVGPDGTDSTYFENPSQNIFRFQSGKYLRVRAFLETDNLTAFEPLVRSISVTFERRPSPTPPVVTVTSPNGGEDWMKTKTYPVTWSASGNLNVTSVTLAYSTDNGTTWTDIASRQDNTGHYKWTVPSVETSGALVRVTVLDIDGNIASDTSDATFAIDPPPPKAGEFLSPLEGDVIAPGAHSASWVVLDPWGLAVRPLTLELTVDGGASWSVLADGLELTDGIDWEAPAMATSSDGCRLRLSVLSWLGDISVIESGDFAIDVTSPEVGLDPLPERVRAGQVVTVTATAQDDLGVQEVTLHVSDATGGSVRTLAMRSHADGSWEVEYVPEAGDARIWASTTDGAHSADSSVQELTVAKGSSGAASGPSLAIELVLAALVALAVVVAIALAVRGREG